MSTEEGDARCKPTDPPRRGDRPLYSREFEAVAATAAYRELIDRLRGRIRLSQARAAQAVNAELVMLYWSIGCDILEQQRRGGWGEDIVGRIAQDLALDTGSVRGFSRRNLFYMRRFAVLWPEREKVPSAVAQIGWTAHRVLLDRFSEDPGLYTWYAAHASRERWSVRYLKGQIDLALHERLGAAVTNFQTALAPRDARALVAVKDPYVFDFLELADDARERQLEQALIDDVQRFLLELGSGFAFYGRQHALLIGRQEVFLDLLFYHHAIRRFVVIELKIGASRPSTSASSTSTSVQSTTSCAAATIARASGSSSAPSATRPSPSSPCGASTPRSPSPPGKPALRAPRQRPPVAVPTHPPTYPSSPSSTTYARDSSTASRTATRGPGQLGWMTLLRHIGCRP